MPDWKAAVRAQMAGLRLPPAEKEEVIAELVSHLEDCDRVSNGPAPDLNRA
jgi:hypothetical protein